MKNDLGLTPIKEYFSNRFKTYGATPQGLDWNSIEAQNIRFEQLVKVISESKEYSLIDYGCGFGSLYEFLQAHGHKLNYLGFDIVEEMINEGRRLHIMNANCKFTSKEEELESADYVIESGVFNLKLDTDEKVWEKHILSTLDKMHALSKKGMSFNLLTRYSDIEFMRSDLYYGDPCFFFDYCKRNYSRNVALLHDYELYDFTIIIRK